MKQNITTRDAAKIVKLQTETIRLNRDLTISANKLSSKGKKWTALFVVAHSSKSV